MLLLNMLLGAVLAAKLLWTLTGLLPRNKALRLSGALYILGSLPTTTGTLYVLRCFLPNFHVFQTTVADDQVLLMNGIYCLVWLAYMSFVSWVFRRPSNL